MNEDSGKVALITGITGQDGAYLTEFLLNHGYTVYGTFRRTSQLLARRSAGGARTPTLASCRTRSDGCRRSRSLAAAHSAVEVYNLAAQSFVGLSFEQPVTTAEIAGIGALHLLEAIRIVNPKIRFY